MKNNLLFWNGPFTVNILWNSRPSAISFSHLNEGNELWHSWYSNNKISVAVYNCQMSACTISLVTQNYKDCVSRLLPLDKINYRVLCGRPHVVEHIELQSSLWPFPKTWYRQKYKSSLWPVPCHGTDRITQLLVARHIPWYRITKFCVTLPMAWDRQKYKDACGRSHVMVQN